MPTNVPGIQCKAVISTLWDNIYKAVDIFQVEEFFVDTAMDTDTDSWSLTLADPKAEFIDLLARDNEVLVAIYVVGLEEITALQKGFADDISIDHEGRMSINGRDMSAVAVDSQAPPQKWTNARPHKIIAKEARKMKIGGRLELTETAPFKKIQRDGSETYWEFWYRLCRKRQLWLWCEPDGTLVSGKLNYGKDPVYRLGTPTKPVGKADTNGWISVERAEWRKNTAGRIGECFVFGHKGDIGFKGHHTDKTIQHWIKRPTRILEDSALHNEDEAKKAAAEEIYEATVGAIEWSLVIADPGFLLAQNNMAQVYIPEIGLDDTLFVVGSRIIGNTGGLYQEVRLREKGFAITRRVPPNPVLREDPSSQVVGGISDSLGVKYSEYFVSAAEKQHGPWEFKLFLGVLLSIGHKETSGTFNMCIQGDANTEWYPEPEPGSPDYGAKLEIHHRKWANHAENPRSRYEKGVGVMQLTTRDFKYKADDLWTGGPGRDEYAGGRWQAEWNILEGAIVLRGKLKGYEQRPTYENIWPGVRDYNGDGPDAEQYMRDVKALYDGTYKALVDTATTASQDQNSTVWANAEGTFAYPLGRRHKGWPDFPLGVPGVGTHAWGQIWQNSNAVDMEVPIGTPVLACAKGTIVRPGEGTAGTRFAGFKFTIASEAGNEYFYTHLSSLTHGVQGSDGRKVRPGDVIGKSGEANGSPHLHWACEFGDPRDLIRDATDRNNPIRPSLPE